MIEISSLANKSFKRALKLKDGRSRKKEKAFLIESRKLFIEAIEAGLLPQTVFVNRKGYGYFYSPENKKNLEIWDRVLSHKKGEPEFLLLKDSLFNELSSFKNPDGIIGLFSTFKIGDAASLQIDPKSTSDRILVLDQIQDPGNMGTIIRSAEAFSFNKILAYKSVDFFNEKVLRASMGSVFRLDLYNISIEDLKSIKEKTSITLLAADMEGLDAYEYNWDKASMLIIGNEGQGLSKEIRRLDPLYLRIDMAGKVESLNAGVSASILMALAAKGDRAKARQI